RRSPRSSGKLAASSVWRTKVNAERKESHTGCWDSAAFRDSISSGVARKTRCRAKRPIANIPAGWHSHWMIRISVWLSCLALTGSAAAPPSEHQAQMAFIESTVQLPEDARPIDEYSRNYALGPDGKIIAIYVVPFEPMGGAPGYDECVVILENSEEKPCSD